MTKSPINFNSARISLLESDSSLIYTSVKFRHTQVQPEIIELEARIIKWSFMACLMQIRLDDHNGSFLL